MNYLDWLYEAALAGVVIPTAGGWDYVINPVQDYLSEEVA